MDRDSWNPSNMYVCTASELKRWLAQGPTGVYRDREYRLKRIMLGYGLYFVWFSSVQCFG